MPAAASPSWRSVAVLLCAGTVGVASLLADGAVRSAAAQQRNGAVAWRPSQKTALEEVERRRQELCDVNKSIWNFAEVGLEETKSSALLVDTLKKAGFAVRTNVADMPTAFVASWGSGKPVIGILAEYDALPGLSQKVSPVREPVQEGGAGHGCGHSGLGSGALGAALAVKAALEKHGLPGTIRLYGTPAEETLIGKVYMLLGGEFRDLDACLHFHPSGSNEVWSGSSKAMVSAKFSFEGIAAHAAGSPHQGRSALDAVELMNVGANFLREHVKEDTRIHYVVTDGGGAPNVVPRTATVWYYVRADRHEDVEATFDWLQDVAKGAALMTRTKPSLRIDTDCHEIVVNDPLSELLHARLVDVGPPKFSAEDHALAARLMESVREQFGTVVRTPLEEDVRSLAESSQTSKGSTDVGDISWYVPTSGIRTTCMASGSPGHSWQNVAAIGSGIGEKGLVYAAQVLAVSALDLFEKPELLAAAKADFQKRTKDRKYTTLVPKGQKAPVRIR